MPKSAQLRLAVLSSMARGPMLDPFTGPNVDRMTADPNVCFIGDDGGDGGEQTETPAPKYTDADMQKAVQTRLSKATKQYESQIADLQAKAAEAEELKARMATLEEERELAGKSATERAQAQAQKELDKLRREIEDRNKLLADKDGAYAQVQTTLRTERATQQVMGALSSEKALNASRAAKYAMTDIVIAHAEDGSMTASYGDVDDGAVADAVRAWLKDNDNFLPAPAGGAGTRHGGHAGGKPLHEQSPAELMKLARTQR